MRSRWLDCLGVPTEIPPPRPARAPPGIVPVEPADRWDEVAVP